MKLCSEIGDGARLFAMTLLLTLAPVCAAAQSKDPERMAVIVYQSLGVEPAAVSAIEKVAGDSARERGYDVMGPATAAARLQPGELDACAGASACFRKAGEKLGVRKMLLVGLGSLGETTMLDLRLLDVNDRAFERSLSSSTATAGADWNSFVSGAVKSLVPAADPHATLVVNSAPAGALIELDGVVLGPAPLRLERKVSPGKHMIAARLPNHVSERREITCEEGQTLQLDLLLQPLKHESVTEKWWFWTAIGVAVAVVATPVIILSTTSAGPAAPLPIRK
ncbi:MAG: hypothetical protein GMKNLPBB_00049 [Myxococcota bacterium]|nr:hypothetical protein [Myxococcota bacterium]